MRAFSMDQVTVSQWIRKRLGITPDIEGDERGEHLAQTPANRGEELVERMIGHGTIASSTEEIMALTRGAD